MNFALTFLFAMIAVADSKSTLWIKREEFDGKRVLKELTLQKCSKTQCAVLCSSTVSCASFFYNGNRDLCFLHGSSYTSLSSTVTDTGCEYYTRSLTEATTTTSPPPPTTTTTTTTTTTVATTTSAQPKVCPFSSSYQLIGSVCFKLVYSSKNWANSRINCQNDGGDLIILDSQEKIDAITPHISASAEYLTGMYDINGYDDFKLIDGRRSQDVTFRAWADTQPDNSAGPSLCGRFQNLKWTVGKCSISRQSLCEVK